MDLAEWAGKHEGLAAAAVLALVALAYLMYSRQKADPLPSNAPAMEQPVPGTGYVTQDELTKMQDKINQQIDSRLAQGMPNATTDPSWGAPPLNEPEVGGGV